MNERQQVIALLARAVADGILSEAQAGEILAAYNAGAVAASLPIPPEQAGGDWTEEAIAGAIMLLLLLWQQSGTAIPATFAARAAAAAQLSGGFQAEAARLSHRLHRGEIALAQWQAEAQGLIQRNLIQQSRLGAGVRSRGGLQPLQAIYREQAAYLSRFADEIAARGMAGLPMSEAQIAQRLGMYAGRGYGQFFREYEASSGSGGAGWVYRYEARDDSRTCYRCLEAEGYYLAGEGPYPGEVCLGRGHCRCRRVP